MNFGYLNLRLGGLGDKSGAAPDELLKGEEQVIARNNNGQRHVTDPG